ncbi:hypothetical protein GCM10020331_063750 [Ectobacillus funiculus]
MEQYRSAEEKQDIETEFIHEETRETRMGRRKKKRLICNIELKNN